jgi:hypothetical protein
MPPAGPWLHLSKLTVSVHLADFLFASLHKMLARSSIPARTSPRRAWGHKLRFAHLCPQLESNQHQRLRSPLLYPLSYGGDIATQDIHVKHSYIISAYLPVACASGRAGQIAELLAGVSVAIHTVNIL